MRHSSTWVIMRLMDAEEPRDLRSFCVFGITRGFTRRSELRVELPTTWARDHPDVAVAFIGGGGDLGWHAYVVGSEGAVLLRFPWYDHADRILRGSGEWERFPWPVSDEEWSDLEQGWFGWVMADGFHVYLADGDLDEILTVRDDRKLERPRPGIVAVDGVEVAWNRVPRVSYDRAWEDAVSSCQAGKPSPVGEWVDESFDRIRLLR